MDKKAPERSGASGRLKGYIRTFIDLSSRLTSGASERIRGEEAAPLAIVFGLSQRPSISKAASVGGFCYPSLTIAVLALDRIDFAGGLHYYRKSIPDIYAQSVPRTAFSF
jgi:hypothetical protein